MAATSARWVAGLSSPQSDLTPDQREALARLQDREFAKRSLPGSMAYFLICAVALAISDIEVRHPVVSYGATAGMLLFGAARLWIAVRFDSLYDRGPLRWRVWLATTHLGIGVLLAMLSSVVVFSGGLNRFSLMFLVAIAGLTAGGMIAASPRPLLLRIWLAVILGPLSWAILASGESNGSAIASMFVLYGVVLAFVGQRLHDVHLGMGLGQLLLEARTLDLEREVERRSNTETALRESEYRLSLVLGAISDGYWDWQVQTGEVYYSPRWCESLGYRPEEVPGRYEFWVGVVHPDDLPKTQAALREHLDGDRPTYEVENRLRRKSEGYRWNFARGRVVERDADGRPVRMVGVDVDITDYKQAEQVLQESEQTLRGIFQAVPAGLGIVQDRVLRSVNERMCEMLGYTADELIGRETRMLYADDESWERTSRKHYSLIREHGSARFEARLMRKDGAPIDVLFHSAALGSGNGSGPVAFAILDITERKRTEQQVREARRVAVEASRLKSEFLANTSHEIRTPMNGILGMAELLEDTVLDEQQRQYLDAIRSSGEQLLSLVSGLLDFSKIEAGKMTIETVPFELREHVVSALKTLELQARRKGLEFTVDIDPSLPEELCGDPIRIRQVLLNLTQNAVKFTERGRVSVRIDAVPDDPGSKKVRFTVEDTGVGIPPDKRDRIFQAFLQADGSTTRRYGGTGLGLAISSNLVRLMGGELELDSEVGRGSAFRFVLDLASEDAPDERVESASFEAAVQRPLAILLAEDNPVNRLVATRILEKAGHRVVAVENGQEALDRLGDGEPVDLVLMDIQMPVMDGLEAVRSLRRRERDDGRRLPVIALTAHAMKEDAARCIEAGMDAYLTKPIRREELLAEISRVLNGTELGCSPRPLL